jgi:uncharacterized protein YgiB involved in biofilm formation
MRRRKASLHISLVLIGAVSLASCGKSASDVRRDEYASLEDCLSDWDNNPNHCRAEIVDKPATATQSGATGSSSTRYITRYYGPPYDWYSDGRRDYGRQSGIASSRSGSSSSATGSSRLGSSRSIGAQSLSSSSSRSAASSSSSISRGGFGSSSARSSSS